MFSEIFVFLFTLCRQKLRHDFNTCQLRPCHIYCPSADHINPAASYHPTIQTHEFVLNYYVLPGGLWSSPREAISKATSPEMSVFCESRRFMAVVTGPWHCAQSWARWIQPAFSSLIYLRLILLLSPNLRRVLQEVCCLNESPLFYRHNHVSRLLGLLLLKLLISYVVFWQ